MRVWRWLLEFTSSYKQKICLQIRGIDFCYINITYTWSEEGKKQRESESSTLDFKKVLEKVFTWKKLI